MRTISASVLIFLALMLSLSTTQLGSFKTHASNGFPVHDLNTGLNYTTIGNAIASNETLSGDTIFVEKGVYNESIAVDKQLHLVGEDRDTTIIDGNAENYAVWLLPDASITNFTIRHGVYGIQAYFQPRIPVPLYGGNSIMSNNVEDCLYAGIILKQTSNNTVMNNVVANNGLSGILLWDSTNDTIANNTVINNLEHGIDLYGYCRDNMLRNNTIADNLYNFGLIWEGDTLASCLDAYGRPNLINDIDNSNTVDGKPIYCWVNKSNEYIPSNAGFVWLTDCDNITVKNLDLTNNVEGIMLAGTTNTLIDSNNITANAYGIHIALFSHDNTLLNNTLRNNSDGVYLGEYASNTIMRNNNISGGQYNFGIPTFSPSYIISTQQFTSVTSGFDDIDLSNTVDGKPIVWWVNQHNLKTPSNAGYVMLINCTDITVEGLNLSNNTQNIILLNSNNTLIKNNTISNAVHGITIEDLITNTSNGWLNIPFVNNTVTDNTFLDNGIGCLMEEGECTILNNTLYGNPLGIALRNATNSIITENTVIGSNINLTYFSLLPPLDVTNFLHPLQYWQLDLFLELSYSGGIMVDGQSNVIYDNTVKDSYCGIVAGWFIGAKDNAICHNNLINNTFQALDSAPSHPQLGLNRWDLGYPTGGNYWSDYAGVDLYSGPHQNETGSDGIGDTLYATGQTNLRVIDNYPLMSPYTDLYDIAIADSMRTRAFFSQHREIINISITVINLSVEAETFNVTFQANSDDCNFPKRVVSSWKIHRHHLRMECNRPTVRRILDQRFSHPCAQRDPLS